MPRREKQEEKEMDLMTVGIWLTVMGMGFVFVFLSLLVVLMVSGSGIIRRFFPEPEIVESPVAKKKIPLDAAVAVAIAAVKRKEN